jgi:hypothetical protein
MGPLGPGPWGPIARSTKRWNWSLISGIWRRRRRRSQEAHGKLLIRPSFVLDRTSLYQFHAVAAGKVSWLLEPPQSIFPHVRAWGVGFRPTSCQPPQAPQRNDWFFSSSLFPRSAISSGVIKSRLVFLAFVATLVKVHKGVAWPFRKSLTDNCACWYHRGNCMQLGVGSIRCSWMVS